jgi:nitrite reductase (NADH) large subunit
MDRLMPRQLDVRASEILLAAVKAHNVKVLLSTEVIAVKGDDKVSSVIARSRGSAADDAGQPIACDMVIYSVGIRPNKKIYENTPLQTNIGVNCWMLIEHTNIDNIYAAGDIAEYNGRVGGLMDHSN